MDSYWKVMNSFEWFSIKYEALIGRRLFLIKMANLITFVTETIALVINTFSNL